VALWHQTRVSRFCLEVQFELGDVFRLHLFPWYLGVGPIENKVRWQKDEKYSGTESYKILQPSLLEGTIGACTQSCRLFWASGFSHFATTNTKQKLPCALPQFKGVSLGNRCLLSKGGSILGHTETDETRDDKSRRNGLEPYLQQNPKLCWRLEKGQGWCLAIAKNQEKSSSFLGEKVRFICSYERSLTHKTLLNWTNEGNGFWNWLITSSPSLGSLIACICAAPKSFRARRRWCGMHGTCRCWSLSILF